MKIGRRAFLGAAGLVALGAKLEAFGPQAAPASATRRWAMVVDIRKCLKDEGCTDCMAACHAAHNVPQVPMRGHEVRWIWREPFAEAFRAQAGRYTERDLRDKSILVFCNHCDNPPCARVCPVKATWKREDGIVMMDWHRCIGCRYCMAACPYGSRSFNWSDPRPYIARITPEFPTRTKGVVEKCNFCEERLAKGRPPACVEACPEKALSFGDLNDAGSPVRMLLASRFSIRRRPELGTEPAVYYLV